MRTSRFFAEDVEPKKQENHKNTTFSQFISNSISGSIELEKTKIESQFPLLTADYRVEIDALSQARYAFDTVDKKLKTYQNLQSLTPKELVEKESLSEELEYLRSLLCRKETSSSIITQLKEKEEIRISRKIEEILKITHKIEEYFKKISLSQMPATLIPCINKFTIAEQNCWLARTRQCSNDPLMRAKYFLCQEVLAQAERDIEKEVDIICQIKEMIIKEMQVGDKSPDFKPSLCKAIELKIACDEMEKKKNQEKNLNAKAGLHAKLLKLAAQLNEAKQQLFIECGGYLDSEPNTTSSLEEGCTAEGMTYVAEPGAEESYAQDYDLDEIEAELALMNQSAAAPASPKR